MRRSCSRAVPFLFFAAVLTGGWTLHAAARQKPPVSPPAEKNPDIPAKEKKEGHFEAQDFFHDSKTQTTTLRDFRYTEGDMTVTGEKATHNRDTKKLLASGKLVMEDPKMHTTGDKADVDTGPKKFAILTGNVVIFLKPKANEPDVKAAPNAADTKTAPGSKEEKADKKDEDASSVRSHGVTITCDRLESFYKKKLATLRGNLIFRQTLTKDGKTVERTLTAEHADYDGKAEKMHLYKPVVGKESDGTVIEFADDVFVRTKEGEETIESKGKVVTHFPVPDEEDESDGKPEDKKADDKKPAVPAKTEPPKKMP